MIHYQPLMRTLVSTSGRNLFAVTAVWRVLQCSLAHIKHNFSVTVTAFYILNRVWYYLTVLCKNWLTSRVRTLNKEIGQWTELIQLTNRCKVIQSALSVVLLLSNLTLRSMKLRWSSQSSQRQIRCWPLSWTQRKRQRASLTKSILNTVVSVWLVCFLLCSSYSMPVKYFYKYLSVCGRNAASHTFLKKTKVCIW